VPGALKVAVVAACAASAKVTVPGPLTLLHADCTTAPAGLPSSVTVPLRSAASGSVAVKSEPAFTFGAVLAGSTVTLSSSLVWCCESEAVRRST
jgi:hypothetical protein